MSSDKKSTDTHKESSRQEHFEDLFDENIRPLAGKGAFRSVAPFTMTPGTVERRKAAQQDEIQRRNSLDASSVIEQVDPYDILSFARPGIQYAVFKKLRQGKYEIQSTLDLHRKTVEQSRQAVWDFLKDCQTHGIRCALITHGKGEGREQPAKLKSCVNHWLRQVDQVLAFHTAKKQHGGSGATYVLIKKNSLARQRTSEQLDQEARRSK